MVAYKVNLIIFKWIIILNIYSKFKLKFVIPLLRGKLALNEAKFVEEYDVYWDEFIRTTNTMARIKYFELNRRFLICLFFSEYESFPLNAQTRHTIIARMKMKSAFSI